MNENKLIRNVYSISKGTVINYFLKKKKSFYKNKKQVYPEP